MPRKKAPQPGKLLCRPLTFRVTEQEYQRLESLRQKSDCHSIGEVIRRSLAGRPVRLFHEDASLDGPLEELAGIRHELHAIGVNINQITRHFNGSPLESRRTLLARQALAQYQQTEAKVSLLLTLISQLARKW